MIWNLGTKGLIRGIKLVAVGIIPAVIVFAPVRAAANPITQCSKQYSNYEQVLQRVKGTSRQPKFMELYDKPAVEMMLSTISKMTDVSYLQQRMKYFNENPQVGKEEFPDDLVAVDAQLKKCVTASRLAQLTTGGANVASSASVIRSPQSPSIASSATSASGQLIRQGNDSACVQIRSNQMWNVCGFNVDVTFCVINPRQTKNAFDNSKAFECPKGGLSTISAGSKEPNILYGTIQWFACDTRKRGTGRVTWNPSANKYVGFCQEIRK